MKDEGREAKDERRGMKDEGRRGRNEGGGTKDEGREGRGDGQRNEKDTWCEGFRGL